MILAPPVNAVMGTGTDMIIDQFTPMRGAAECWQVLAEVTQLAS